MLLSPLDMAKWPVQGVLITHSLGLLYARYLKLFPE